MHTLHPYNPTPPYKGLLLISYETLVGNLALMKAKNPYGVIVCDEAHRLKNTETKVCELVQLEAPCSLWLYLPWLGLTLTMAALTMAALTMATLTMAALTMAALTMAALTIDYTYY